MCSAFKEDGGVTLGENQASHCLGFNDLEIFEAE